MVVRTQAIWQFSSSVCLANITSLLLEKTALIELTCNARNWIIGDLNQKYHRLMQTLTTLEMRLTKSSRARVRYSQLAGDLNHVRLQQKENPNCVMRMRSASLE